MEAQLTWVAAASQIIAIAVRYVKSDSPLPEWLHVAPKWRPLLAIALGQALAVFDAVGLGSPWPDAIAKGALAAAVAMVGHVLVIEKGRGGKELPVPFARDTGQDTGKDGAQ